MDKTGPIRLGHTERRLDRARNRYVDKTGPIRLGPYMSFHTKRLERENVDKTGPIRLGHYMPSKLVGLH